MTIKKHNNTLIYRTIITTIFVFILTSIYLLYKYQIELDKKNLIKANKILILKEKDFKSTNRYLEELKTKYKKMTLVMINQDNFKKEFEDILIDLNKMKIFDSKLIKLNKSYLHKYKSLGEKENILEITVNINSKKRYLTNEQASVFFIAIFKEVFPKTNFKEFRYLDEIVTFKYHKIVKR